MEIRIALIACVCYALLNGIDAVLGWGTLQRPIVAGPIIGFLLGDVKTGIILGGALEAIFMGVSPIGGTIPADGLSSAIIVVAFTKITGADLTTGIALALPIGALMATVTNLSTPIFAALAPAWEKLAARANQKLFLIVMTVFAFVANRLPVVIVLFVSIAFGVTGLQSVFQQLPAWFMAGLNAGSSMMIAIGFAILTSMIWDKEVGIFLFLGFVLAKYLGLPPVAIAIIAGTIAVTYYYNDTKMMKMINANKKAEDEVFFE